jgi:hypothetical protein
MAANDVRDRDSSGIDGASAEEGVSAHESCPGRTVFTERGNPDGWISTDTTLPVDD